MNTGILTPMSLFQLPIRYTIPEFQRRYVWNQDEQWEPLWDDVRNTAETYLEELERQGNDSVLAVQNMSTHFFGAVVLQDVSVAVNDIPRREVIDGQQRLTTLQLLLDAIQYVCEEFQLAGVAARLLPLVENPSHFVQEDDHTFKLWPTNTDRDAFRHAMRNGLATDGFENSLIVQAHEFFQLQVREWLNAAPDSRERMAEALQVAVTAMLNMVVIQLGTNDDPHVIFETLNARGTPLLESDLIKNYIMSRLDGQDINVIWRGLETDWWRAEVGTGHLRRPRLDLLLNYWLITRTARQVTPSRVFNVFRSYASDSPIDEIASTVRNDLENYRLFETRQRTPDENMFTYRTDVMRVGAITPVLLFLLTVPAVNRINALRALESFLIRRMVCRGSTRDYARLTLDLVGELKKRGDEKADRVVIDFLKNQTSDSREWPDDMALEYSVATLPLYRVLTRGRLRLVLEGIERNLRESSMAEEHAVPRGLTIEHVMPVSWRANWPLPESDNELDTASARNRLIHTIGNLTLIRGRLNSKLSNASWDSKRKTLGQHSTLSLNKEFMDETATPDWNEESIQARSRRMAKIIAEVWPGPNSPAWDE